MRAQNALDAKRGVSRHLWEQHGSAGKRAPAAASSEHHFGSKLKQLLLNVLPLP
jgi:hypothetical protein